MTSFRQRVRLSTFYWRFSSASGKSKLLSALTFLSKFGCKEYATGKMHQILHHFPAVPNTLHQGKMRDVAESVSRSTDALLALPH